MNYLLVEHEIAKRENSRNDRIVGSAVIGGLTGGIGGYELGDWVSENRNIKRAGEKGRAEAIARHGRFENLGEQGASAYGRTLRRVESKQIRRLSRRAGIRGALIGAPLTAAGTALIASRKKEKP